MLDMDTKFTRVIDLEAAETEFETKKEELDAESLKIAERWEALVEFENTVKRHDRRVKLKQRLIEEKEQKLNIQPLDAIVEDEDLV